MQDCGYKIVFNGIDNYLFLLDFIDKDIIGKDVDVVFGCVNIIVNKNLVLKDLCLLFVISGLCIGILVIICCGFKVEEVQQVVSWICDILDNMGDESVVECV